MKRYYQVNIYYEGQPHDFDVVAFSDDGHTELAANEYASAIMKDEIGETRPCDVADWEARWSYSVFEISKSKYYELKELCC